MLPLAFLVPASSESLQCPFIMDMPGQLRSQASALTATSYGLGIVDDIMVYCSVMKKLCQEAVHIDRVIVFHGLSP